MKKIVIAVLVIIVLVSIISVYIFLNRASKIMSQAEKEAAIAKILGRKPNLTDDTPKGDTTYQGKYISFMYPARAKIYTYVDPNFAQNESLLETFSFDIDNPRLIFNFSIVENTGNLPNVSEISGVKLRQDKTRGYKQSEVAADGYNGLFFEKDGSKSEKTGFFLVNNKIYSFSIQSSDSKAVNELFNKIVSSVKFL